MAQRITQYLQGTDSVRIAHELSMKKQDRRDEWPYPHIFPPKSAVDVHRIGIVLMPASGGTTVEVIRHEVSAGKIFFLTAVVFQTSGVSTFNANDFSFTLIRNSPAGVSDSQAQPEHGLAGIGIPLGSFTFQQWYVQRAREFRPLDVVRILGTNQNITPGANVYFACGIFGFEIPDNEVLPK